MTISDDNGAKKLLNEMRDGRGSFSKVFTGFLSLTTSQKSLLLHFPKLSVGPDQKTEDNNSTTQGAEMDKKQAECLRIEI